MRKCLLIKAFQGTQADRHGRHLNVFSIWYSYLSLPAGLVLFGIWVAAAIIAFIVARMRKSKLGSA